MTDDALRTPRTVPVLERCFRMPINIARYVVPSIYVVGFRTTAPVLIRTVAEYMVGAHQSSLPIIATWAIPLAVLLVLHLALIISRPRPRLDDLPAHPAIHQRPHYCAPPTNRVSVQSAREVCCPAHVVAGLGSGVIEIANGTVEVNEVDGTDFLAARSS